MRMKFSCKHFSLVFHESNSAYNKKKNLDGFSGNPSSEIELKTEETGSGPYLLTPTFPNVLVLLISGRIQERSFLWSGCLIQSSQNLKTQTNTVTLLQGATMELFQTNYFRLIPGAIKWPFYTNCF